MRQFKFRAWHNNDMTYFFLGDSLVDDNEKIVDFRDLTVMQFTGLLDKNGKEIYEGDILKGELGVTGVVQWYKDGYEIRISEKMYSRFHIFGEYEVVSNIYENPELC
jgi:uncharacterized phage protein (TIGR01671 family)